MEWFFFLVVALFSVLVNFGPIPKLSTSCGPGIRGMYKLRPEFMRGTYELRPEFLRGTHNNYYLIPAYQRISTRKLTVSSPKNMFFANEDHHVRVVIFQFLLCYWYGKNSKLYDLTKSNCFVLLFLQAFSSILL